MPINLKIKGHDYDQFYKEISDDHNSGGYDSDEFINISGMPPLEGDEEEVKEETGLKNKQTIN